MRGFLLRLRSGYHDAGDGSGGDITGCVFSLDLAVSALEDLKLQRPAPLHISVLGPTQAGKSTIVNLLLGQPAATTSPLAGFTRSLHGFPVGVDDAQQSAINEFVSQAPGAPVSVHSVDQPRPALAKSGYVVWDTPDFDSHSSREYRSLITQVVALSDLIVLVVSKEKYSDWTVWKVLDLLYPLQRPLIICLNKAPRDPQPLRLALRGRVDQSRYQTQNVPICTLPQVDRGRIEALMADSSTDEFLHTVRSTLTSLDMVARRKGVHDFVGEHWDEWLLPVRMEHDAAATWRGTVADAVHAAVYAYSAQYLDHSRHEGTFNRAMVQLLELLEIPALARPLASTRRFLTWPFRALFAGAGRARTSSIDVELDVLTEIFEHALLSLRRTIAEGADGEGHRAHWWRAMAKLFDKQSPVARSEFIDAVSDYQRNFEPEVESAAKALYEKLAQNPATLNSLRAARVTADAAGVALAFKTGAIGVNELVLTPAMLSLTSFLTESAVGKYMDVIKEQLKNRQRHQVEDLITRFFSEVFSALPDVLDDKRLFLIDRDELERVEQLRQSM